MGVLRQADFLILTNMHTYLKIGSFLLAAFPGLLACGDSHTAPTGTRQTGAVVVLTAKVDAEIAAMLTRVEVMVTAADMPVMHRTLAVDGDRIVGTVSEIPAGTARLFTVVGYNARRRRGLLATPKRNWTSTLGGQTMFPSPGDWLGAYPGGPQTNPQGPTEGTARVFRGGSFKDAASLSRSAQRCWNAPDQRFSHVGVRLVRDLDS